MEINFIRSGSKSPIPSHVTSRLVDSQKNKNHQGLLSNFQGRKIIIVNSANRGELPPVGGSILRKKMWERERERDMTDSCLHGNHPSNHSDYGSKIKVIVAIIEVVWTISKAYALSN